MKRFFIQRSITILISLLFPVLMFADRVPVDRARAVAERFFRCQPAVKAAATDLQLVWDGTDDPFPEPGTLQTASFRSNEDPAFYLFNNRAGLGFVVIAGEDTSAPVLGYSFDSNVKEDDLPVNFVNWMLSLKEEIRYSREQNFTAPASVKGLWEDYAVPDALRGRSIPGNVVLKHETASWDQDEPYWNQCPSFGRNKTFTGCVITSVCIAMKFHKWPSAGTGTVPAYTTYSNSIRVPARKLGKAYDWDSMPLKYHDKYHQPLYTAEQAEQVSRLMADVGAALEADYGTEGQGGTGAFSQSIPQALTEYMGYDKSIHLEGRAYYKTPEWIALMKETLAGGPVIYGGSTASDEGHSFLLDGYTDQDYFHVNWGWSGLSDGYFLLSALDPETQGAGGADSGFNYWQDAVVNMFPDKGGQPVEIISMSSYDEKDVHLHGIKASASNFQTGETFVLGAGAFFNDGLYPFFGEVVLAVADMNGNFKEKLMGETFRGNLPMDPEYIYWLEDESVKIAGPIEPGDRIMAFYRKDNSEDYLPVRYSLEDGTVGEILIAEEPDPAMVLDRMVSFSYNRADRVISLDYPSGVQLCLLSSAGADLTGQCAVGEQQTLIAVKELPAGVYKLELSYKGVERKFDFKI